MESPHFAKDIHLLAEAMQAAGIRIAKSPAHIGEAMVEAMGAR